MPAIVDFPDAAKESMPTCADCFQSAPQRKHVMGYLTGLMEAYSLLVLQFRQHRAKGWDLTGLKTIVQACRAITTETYRATLEWAITEIVEKKKSLQPVKPPLGAC